MNVIKSLYAHARAARAYPHPIRPRGDPVTYTIHQGDSLAILRTIPDETVDAIICDPPYSSGGMFRGDRNHVPSYLPPGITT